jgi:uncharacterized protein YecT (DUF1311 family)
VIFLSIALAQATANCSTTSVQSELNECALAEYVEADEALNRQWKVTLRAVRAKSTVRANGLLRAQRAWIVNRDTKCDKELPWSLGVSLDKMMNINCRTGLTIKRINELKRLAQGI